jgi:phospholipid transport system substrate-binding protein
MARRRFALALAFLLTPALLRAAAPTDEAAAVVQHALDAALATATAQKTRDENLAALRTVAGGFLDTKAMGRRAIGDALAAQPAPQQAEYLALFDELLVRAYLQKLLLFRSPRFLYGEPRRDGDVVIVPTRIATTKDEYKVDYDMREHDGRWLATDVVVEGISLTDNYREQFASILRDRSFAELLDVMRTKLGRAKPTAAP